MKEFFATKYAGGGAPVAAAAPPVAAAEPDQAAYTAEAAPVAAPVVAVDAEPSNFDEAAEPGTPVAGVAGGAEEEKQ